MIKSVGFRFQPHFLAKRVATPLLLGSQFPFPHPTWENSIFILESWNRIPWVLNKC